MARKLPPQEELLKHFEYFDGRLIRKFEDGSRRFVDNTLNKTGYASVKFNYIRYLVSRLIWKLHFNEDPETIDHINNNRIDNRIENLRNISFFLNQHNKKKKETGCIYYNEKNKKWISRISIKHKTKYLGSFTTFAEAVECKNKARQALFQGE